jgi:hypothetical protein
MKTLLKMLRHKAIVTKNFEAFISKIREREVMHDVSKYIQDEFDGFSELDSEEVFKLHGTDMEEYKKRLSENKGISLHYLRNSHHPEHFVDAEHSSAYAFGGIDFMKFTDLLEMVIDWKSACETYGTDFEESFEKSIKRFMPSSYTEYMIRMIASDLYGLKMPPLK